MCSREKGLKKMQHIAEDADFACRKRPGASPPPAGKGDGRKRAGEPQGTWGNRAKLGFSWKTGFGVGAWTRGRTVPLIDILGF